MVTKAVRRAERSLVEGLRVGDFEGDPRPSLVGLLLIPSLKPWRVVSVEPES